MRVCVCVYVRTLPRCVLIVLDEPCQTEVGNLAHKVVSDEDVSSTQVPVDVVHPLDESHAVGDLHRIKTTQ